jgi:hypothetical protein
MNDKLNWKGLVRRKLGARSSLEKVLGSEVGENH